MSFTVSKNVIHAPTCNRAVILLSGREMKVCPKTCMHNKQKWLLTEASCIISKSWENPYDVHQ